MIVLAGDVGGTNARLAVVSIDGASLSFLREERYPSRDYPGLAPIVQHFLQGVEEHPLHACFGIAGPIVNDECRASNLPWTINAAALGAAIQVPGTTLINDFAAVGHGIERLQVGDVVTLQEGDRVSTGPIGLIGAGTGLGEGFLTWQGQHYQVNSSEGGHQTFAARDDLEWGLSKFLHAQFGHVSSERVLSGSGLVQIYRYLVSLEPSTEQPAVHDAMKTEDPAAVISRFGLAGTDGLSGRALDLFASMYGAQAGDLALMVVSTGGIYLAGGIAPRIVSKLSQGGFISAFRDKGRFVDFLSRVPVHIITNAKVGLMGAAAVAHRLA